MAAIHDQPSKKCCVEKKRKKSKTKANENAKAAQFAFVFFSCSALMRTFTRQQYLLYPPREKSETEFPKTDDAFLEP